MKSKYVLSILGSLLLILTFTPSASAANATEIRAIYDGSEPVVVNVGPSEDVLKAQLDYEETGKEYVRAKSQKRNNMLAIDQLLEMHKEASKKVKDSSEKLSAIYSELVDAVNSEESLKEIFKLEQQYVYTREQLERESFLANALLRNMHEIDEMDSRVVTITDQEFLDSYIILQQMMAEYELASSYDDIGEVTNLLPPVSNGKLKINSPYGMRLEPFGAGYYQMHDGLDIDTEYGEHNLALFHGEVVVSATSSSYGNYVIIDHGMGVKTLYAHAEKNLVSVGDKVEQYQIIQETGSTGYSTGPHLHLVVTIDGQYVDPMKLFK